MTGVQTCALPICKITVFGLGGDSQISMLDSKNGNQQDMYTDEGQDLVNRSKMGTLGISLTRYLNDRTYAKLILSGVYQSGGTTIDTLDVKLLPHPNIDHNYAEYRTSVSGYINTKRNSQFSVRSGFSADRMGFDLLTKTFSHEINGLRPVIDYSKGLADGMTLVQPYV